MDDQNTMPEEEKKEGMPAEGGEMPAGDGGMPMGGEEKKEDEAPAM